MKKILVLGSGCQKCEALYAQARQAAEQLGIEYEIEKVTDFAAIAGYGVMRTPALVVDGEVKLSGAVLPAEQLKAMLS